MILDKRTKSGSLSIALTVEAIVMSPFHNKATELPRNNDYIQTGSRLVGNGPDISGKIAILALLTCPDNLQGIHRKLAAESKEIDG